MQTVPIASTVARYRRGKGVGRSPSCTDAVTLYAIYM